MSSPDGSRASLCLIVCAAFILGFVAGVGYSAFRAASGGENAPHVHTDAGTMDLTTLEQAAQKEPDQAQSWVRLGNACADSGRIVDAIAAYNRALAIDPYNNDVRTDLGVAYFNNKQPAEAIYLFDLALHDDPKHPQARFNKGVVLYNGLGEREKALAEWRKLLADRPDIKSPTGESLAELIRRVEQEKDTLPAESQQDAKQP